MDRALALAPLACILALSMCAKRDASTAAPDGGTATLDPPSSAAPAPPPSAAPPSTIATGGDSTQTSLMGKLVTEARNRPTIKPNADDVVAAFARLGAPVGAPRQGLGATYKARYCTGGSTPDGALTFGVCEFDDAASAQAELAPAKALLQIKDRDVWAHKETLLSIIRLQDTPATRALEGKLAAAYQAM